MILARRLPTLIFPSTVTRYEPSQGFGVVFELTLDMSESRDEGREGN
jgi:hypothetical protein